MKLRTNLSRLRTRGISLIECLVYLVVFAILMNIGGAAFYFCWDHSKALIYATDDVESALRAGEDWRADVRLAAGRITVETNAAGEVIRIPENGKEILYRFASGEVRRQVASESFSQLLLAKVKASQMQSDARGDVAAWRWELELTQRRRETQMPLLFTFEAVAKNTP
jgi:hypothetical protein